MATPQPARVSDLPVRLGKHEILTKLAVGGMAEIYLARATGIEGFQKHVVIKRIRPQLAEDEKFVHMFLDEARIAAQLHHQNIAQVYDIGEDAGVYYFAMEYLHGSDTRGLLKAAVKKRQPIPLAHALTIIAGAAAGLEYAHNKLGANGKPLDIVHRDISPSNIIVTYDGAVKVVDFGIARASERSSETMSGSLKGKISYMSPEQCKGQALDRRSDVFSLGICLYELTTMSRMFPSKKLSEYVIMDQLVKGAFPRPSAKRADYPADLERIVMRALAVNPDDRYPTAADFGADIEKLAAVRGMPLSTPALSRWIVGLLGRKPEPWHDLQAHDSPLVEDDGPAEQTISTTGVDVPADDASPTVPTVGARSSFGSEVSIEIIRPRRRWIVPVLVLAIALVVGVIAAVVRMGGSDNNGDTPSAGEADEGEPAGAAAADDVRVTPAPTSALADEPAATKSEPPREDTATSTPTPTDPEAQPTDPEAQPAEPEAQPTEPEAQPAEPATEPTEPAAKPAKTTSKPRAKPKKKPAKKKSRRSDGLLDRSW